MQAWPSEYAFQQSRAQVDESSCSTSSPPQQPDLSKNTSSCFQSSTSEFKLPHSPAASSSSGSSTMETATSEPARRSAPTFPGARRPSMLNSEMTMDADFAQDDAMDSPFQDEAMPSPTAAAAIPMSTPSRQVAASVWSKGSTFANTGQAIPRNAMHDEAMDGFNNASARSSARSSFNPLNPLGIRPNESKEIMQPQASTSYTPVRPGSSLQRAKSSPALGRLDGEPATPPSHRMTMDDQSQTFDGLGMSLPDRDTEQISSPPKGPVRRPVAARRGNLFPKVKAYLRVAASLQDETSSRPDVDEIAGEAALHKLASSRPMPFSDFAKLKGFSGATDNTLRPIGTQSIKNRFPETALTEAEEATMNRHSSSDSDDAEVSESNIDEAEASSAAASRLGISGANTSGDSETWKKEKEVWGAFREHRGSPGSAGGFGARYAASLSNAGMELDSPSSIAARPGKRKAMDSDARYEYQSFKRRAVSPSSTLGSPVLGHDPNPISGTPSAISIPPQNSASFFASLNHPGRASPPPNQSSAKASTYNIYASGASAAVGMQLGSILSHRASSGTANEEEDLAPLDQMKL